MSDGRVLHTGAYGQQITPDTGRAGVVDDGLIAWPERIDAARRQWTQVPAEDFEHVGRRRWRDRGSGLEYRQVGGCPLMSVGTDAVRNVSAFFVHDGRLVFLARADIPEGTFIHHGEVIGRQVDVQLAPVRIH